MGPYDVQQTGSDQGLLPPPQNHGVSNHPRYWQDYAGDAWRQGLEMLGAYPTEGQPTADQARLARGMFGSDGFNSSGRNFGLAGNLFQYVAPQAKLAAAFPYLMDAAEGVVHGVQGKSSPVMAISNTVASGLTGAAAGGMAGALPKRYLGNMGQLPPPNAPTSQHIPVDSFRIVKKQLPSTMTGPLNRMNAYPPNQPWGRFP